MKKIISLFQRNYDGDRLVRNEVVPGAGWVAAGDGPEDQYHREAFAFGCDWIGADFHDGIYELIGPKVQGGPEEFVGHVLIRHDTSPVYADCPRSFDGIKEWLGRNDVEGIVWHHPDGRMVKVKAKDFGIKRAARQTANA